MNKQLNLKQLLVSLLLGAALVLTGWATTLLKPAEVPKSLGGTLGLEAETATTSQNSLIGGSVSTLIATSSACATRVITTKASPILLTFSEVQNSLPSATTGHLQAASTTVVYSAQDFGCDNVKGLTADGTNSVITISETR